MDDLWKTYVSPWNSIYSKLCRLCFDAYQISTSSIDPASAEMKAKMRKRRKARIFLMSDMNIRGYWGSVPSPWSAALFIPLQSCRLGRKALATSTQTGLTLEGQHEEYNKKGKTHMSNHFQPPDCVKFYFIHKKVM